MMTGVMNKQLIAIHLDNDEISLYRWIGDNLRELLRAVICFLHSKQITAVNPPPPPQRNGISSSGAEKKERGDDKQGLCANKSSLLFFESASGVNTITEGKEFESTPELADKGMFFSTLPVDIQVDIFLKLPVNSILACRCACKVWCKLLSSDNFITEHLHHASPKLMLKHLYQETNKVMFGSIDYTSVSSSWSSTSSTYDWDVPRYYDFRDMLYGSIQMVGTCNGLICLALDWYGDTHICIWNPATGEYKKMPLPSSSFFFGELRRGLGHAFYHDCIADAYKLVKIAEKRTTGTHQVDVYTLGSKSCSLMRTYESINRYQFPAGKEELLVYFVNGALHWIGNHKINGVSSTVVVSFNVGNERFKDILFPEEVQQLISNRDRAYDCVLGVLEDCLSLGIYYDKCHIDLWLKQDYGVGESSWSKRYSFCTTNISADTGLTLHNDSRNLIVHRMWTLLWTFPNGELLINTGPDKLLYDPKKNRFGALTFHMYNDDTMSRAKLLNYVESLVSPNSIGY